MVKVGLGRGLMYLWFTLNHTRPVTSKKATKKIDFTVVLTK